MVKKTFVYAAFKNIPIQKYKNSAEKDEYQYIYRKGDENKGIVEYGYDYVNCKLISDKKLIKNYFFTISKTNKSKILNPTHIVVSIPEFEYSYNCM